MADDDALLWTHRPRSPRQPKPGELLFECVRPRDRTIIRCELRFHGESYGWEVQFFEGPDEFYARGAFVLRELAIRWAEEERDAMLRE
jgi:hypothetical protein